MSEIQLKVDTDAANTNIPAGRCNRTGHIANRIGAVLAAALTLTAAIGAVPVRAVEIYADPDPVIADTFATATDNSAMSVSVLMGASDVRRYQTIFELQARGQMAAADPYIDRLSDPRLLGHVLSQRYLHPDNSGITFDELTSWLAAYGDHPHASRIYRLAESQRGTAPPPPEPEPTQPLWGVVESFGIDRCDQPEPTAIERRALSHVRDLVGRTRPTAALNWLERPDHRATLSETVRSQARANIAAGYFHAGYADRARTEAEWAAERSGGLAPRALWIAGLSAWVMDDPSAAVSAFQRLATAACADAWQRTAGAFWAARAHDRLGNRQGRTQWLAVTASYPYTFYGLVARRMLGLDIPFTFDQPDLSDTHLALVNATPRGHRAIGLLQVGLTDLASTELSALIAGRPSIAVRDGVVAIAQESRLAALSLSLGGAITAGEDRLFDGALYPIPAWEPQNGYYIDRALLLATMRQESRFDPDATSHAGATGLMQLMPATADAMARHHLDVDPDAGLELTDPGLNVELGQAYFRQLMATNGIDDDLISMIAAYNAGPGNVRRWRSTLEDDGDPFLFIERISVRETRNYVKQVLANFWIYRSRLNQQAPSLDAIARFERPRYSGQDATVTEIVSDHGAH